MAMSNWNVANRVTEAMVTSKQMRRVVPILLSLVLAMGGLCGSLCFAQAATDGAAHSCCHEKNHCGDRALAMQSDRALAISQIVPVILTEPVRASSLWFAASGRAALPHPIEFSPPLRTSVLRL
jgi:hypothetical protein